MVMKKSIRTEENYSASLDNNMMVPLSNVVNLDDAVLHSRALFGRHLVRVEKTVVTKTTVTDLF